jgi:hypothetical protein
VRAFRYVDHDFEPATGVLRCRYALDDLPFEERITFSPTRRDDLDEQAIRRAMEMVFLLAGISYFKAAAPLSIRVERLALTPALRRLLLAYYVQGLGEFAFRNGLDLSELQLLADERTAAPPSTSREKGRPLVPFGGGLDSITTVEGIRAASSDAALFIVSQAGASFDAIENAAQLTGLPIVRASRRLDSKILESNSRGFRNGHVPVTGIISAIAVAAALLDGRDAVVMSNEWSASSGNVEMSGRVVNHQWSKSLEFEDLFRDAIHESLPNRLDYFSWLRPFSELWVASRFSHLVDYHRHFRSCNRAFAIDPAARLDHWCGRCDKCCFIDLILAPFMSRTDVESIFDHGEPLANGALLQQFRALLGVGDANKPFECVGDVDECRVALLLSNDRSDRASTPMVSALAEEVRPLIDGNLDSHVRRLLQPLSKHRIPPRYAPETLVG